MFLQSPQGRSWKLDAVSTFSIVPWEYERSIQPISPCCLVCSIDLLDEVETHVIVAVW